MRRVPSRQRNRPIVRERDRGAVKRFALLLAAGLILAGGFVYAGGQHFAALKFGYETEKLRNSLTEAREQQRRLLLEKEIASSPARLEQAARQLGMQPMQAGQIDPLRQTQIRELKPVEMKTPATAKAPPKVKTQKPQTR